MTSVSFETGSSSVTEGSATTVRVELTAAGGQLTDEVTVTVSDATVGTATAGADYTPPPATVLTFPAGSMTGDTRSVNVTALNDSFVEDGSETLRLSLSSPSAGLALGAQSNHQLSVLDANTASVGFTQAAVTTPDEATANYDATVELSLAAGDSLAVPITVTVTDSSGGTASSGVDYVFNPVPITFTAGSTDGATSTVQIAVQDDGAMESDETIVLSLDTSNVTAVVNLGANDEHVLTITEDEQSVLPFLQVTKTGGGSPDVSSGSSLSFGSQPSGGGPTGAVTLTLRNLGTQPLSLSQANLSGDVEDFELKLMDPDALMPPPAGLAPPATLPPAVFPMAALGEDANRGVQLLYDADLGTELEGRDSVTLLGVPLPDGRTCSLELERADSPWTADAVLHVDGADHAVADVLDGVSHWRGEVQGDEGSRVFLSFSSLGSTGFIQCGDGERFELVSERADEEVVEEQTSRLIASEVLESQTVLPAYECSSLQPPVWMPTASSVVAGQAPAQLTVGFSVADCRLAIETDYQLYQKFGNVSATATYVTQLIAAISDQYETDAQVSLSIAYLGIYSNPADPWTSADGGGDAGDLLSEFRGAWNSSGWPAPADLAHFISGANLGGGVAYVNVLCNSSYGYGVSGNIGGNIDWNNWTGQPGSTWDFVVVAHELGHNFGASHTHSYCPPVDYCYTNCSSGSNCPQGTIMSYCHVCGGMANIQIGFHPFIANVIRTAVGSSCLGGSSLAGGGRVDLELTFSPAALSGAGAKSATLGFTHDGNNVASPFTVLLNGAAQ